MRKVYFISGLGADKRAFSLLDLSFCEPVFVDWITPLPHETLRSYAARLRKQIPDEHPTIVGISFGGMLATEMARSDEMINAVIIASSKSADEFPFYLRIGKYIPFYKWMPGNWLTKTRHLHWIFGPKGAEQKRLLKEIIADANPQFLKWAVEAILNWDEKLIPANVKHIHGTADRLLLLRYVKADIEVPGGTHLMSMNMPHEISTLLHQLLR